jgi:hypothetical protein
MANNPPMALPHQIHRDQPRGLGTTNSTTQQLLGPLNHLNSVAQQLLHSLSPTHTKPPPPPPVTALADADAALAAAVQLTRLHQKKQQHIESLKADVLALEDSWRTVIMKLEEGRRDLEAIISEGDIRLAAIEQAKDGTAAERRPLCSSRAVVTGLSQVQSHTPSSWHTPRV